MIIVAVCDSNQAVFLRALSQLTAWIRADFRIESILHSAHAPRGGGGGNYMWKKANFVHTYSIDLAPSQQWSQIPPSGNCSVFLNSRFSITVNRFSNQSSPCKFLYPIKNQQITGNGKINLRIQIYF